MKNPNGYGSCYRLPGNRRKPWAVRITVGKDGGIYKYKYLGYYETQEDGLIALAEYNRNPFDPDMKKITFAEMYELWRDFKGPASRSSLYITPFNTLKALHDIQFSALRPVQILRAIDESGKNITSIQQMKNMFSVLYKFAVGNDYCLKDYTDAIDLSKFLDRKPECRPHTMFTEQEIRALWDQSDDQGASVFLILLYTGMRVMELLTMRKEDVNIDARMLHVQKSKTAAGVRTVPVAKKILPLVRNLYDESASAYLLSPERGAKYQYSNFRTYVWDPVLLQLHMDHSPHDCRHTMISRMSAAGVDERMIGRIVGHAAGNVTVDVYTHYTDQQLLAAVDLL